MTLFHHQRSNIIRLSKYVEASSLFISRIFESVVWASVEKALVPESM